MARKNLLAGLVDADTPEEAVTASSYPMRGASKNMIRSLDEIARQADRFLEGETIVELDPAVIDGSFVSDRMEADSEEFNELLAAIRERGQDSPILVRPNPTVDGRFQIVFGHRRVRVARELGRKVRAVVKPLDDRTHVIAQGQENSARANLTFVERALFAKRLDELGYDRDVMASALAANAASVSKMMSVATRISTDLLLSIGPAPSVGRERWVEMSLLVGKIANDRKVQSFVASDAFRDASSDERFSQLFGMLNKTAKPVRKTTPSAEEKAWTPVDRSVRVTLSTKGKTATIALAAANGPQFATYITERLDDLYEAFRQSTNTKQGD